MYLRKAVKEAERYCDSELLGSLWPPPPQLYRLAELNEEPSSATDMLKSSVP